MQQFNLFPKANQYQQTSFGGCLSVFTIVLILFLITSEIRRSFQLKVESIIDNTNIDDRVRVNVNITFHSASCHSLSLDLQDVTGSHLEDVQHTIHKLRMFDDQYIDPFSAINIHNFEQALFTSTIFSLDEINDCYGAQLYEGQKCITCQDVMMAYSSREWPQPQRESVKQCKYAYIQSQGRLLFTDDFGKEKRAPQLFNMQDIANVAITQGEGCQFYGHFYIKKVPGNFHFSFHGRGQAAIFLGQSQNLNHTIHLLEFSGERSGVTNGKYLPSSNPLDNTYHNNREGQDSQYYLKLVETRYEYLFDNIDLYTFKAYEHKSDSKDKLPQVQFKYEYDAITMRYYIDISLNAMMTIFCAVIGGVFAMSKYIATIVDRILIV